MPPSRPHRQRLATGDLGCIGEMSEAAAAEENARSPAGLACLARPVRDEQSEEAAAALSPLAQTATRRQCAGCCAVSSASAHSGDQ